MKESICINCKNLHVDVTASCSENVYPLAHRKECNIIDRINGGTWENQLCSILTTNALRYLSQNMLEVLVHNLAGHLDEKNKINLIKDLTVPEA